jgi:CheY-like chemotaxis protein
MPRPSIGRVIKEPKEKSSPASSQSHRVAFLGFSEFERTALATYFRLAAEREHRYELVYTLTDADFLVADADHAPSVQLVVVTERLAETVFIGSQAPAGAAGSMRRPIDAMHVMRALDALGYHPAIAPLPSASPTTSAQAADGAAVAGSQDSRATEVIVESMLRMPPPPWALPGAPAQAPAQTQAPVQTPVTPPPPGRRPAPEARRAPEGSALVKPARRAGPRPVLAAGLPPGTPSFVGPPPPPRALLVDDSNIALRFLASRLMPWCVRTESVSTSEDALSRLAERDYDFIFLDLELGAGSELDGLALCRHIKRSELAMNATLVMVSAHHSEIDRARGALAGCDAYLGKPLKESELSAVLRRQGLPAPEGAPARALAPTGAWPG